MFEMILIDKWRALTLILLVGGAAMTFLVPALSQDQGSKAKIERVPLKEDNETSGAKLYHSHCAACHGQDGRGNGPAARALKTAPTDLTQLARNSGGKFPSDHVWSVLTNESDYPIHGSKDMPIWGPIFSRSGTEQNMGHLRAHNLVEYLRSVQAK
jgi:mono/diheme cytochrome c family protein